VRPTRGAGTAAVIGRPIDHSLSPLIQTTWLDAAGIAGRYVALAPGDPDELFALLDSGDLVGCNVTAPYKGDAFAWAEQRGLALGAAARATGSVNLLILGDQPRADSTDGMGLVAAIREQAPDHDLSQGPAVVLGAGGAARAAVQAVLAEGCSQVRVVNRTLARAQALADRMGMGVSAWPWEAIGTALDGGRLVINATTRIEPPDLTPVAPDAVVLDMSYRPLETPLLAVARTLGLRPVDGLAMLIGQARPSFTALFGQPVPEVDVRSVCLRALEEERCG